MTLEMRTPCKSCGHPTGYRNQTNGQAVIRCSVCNTYAYNAPKRSDVPLHVGHLISVEDGRSIGMTDDDLWNEHNLAAMCDECNLGLGRDSVTLNLMARLFYVWKNHA